MDHRCHAKDSSSHSTIRGCALSALMGTSEIKLWFHFQTRVYVKTYQYGRGLLRMSCPNLVIRGSISALKGERRKNVTWTDAIAYLCFSCAVIALAKFACQLFSLGIRL
ncbi:hypothetical protein AB6A40_011479 [Gnathostoma spinigerum]|uniref:Uncharacterized protein n=1 Tax=Gnathostoma spinigerum TaxID=75299 RepID=A0ABD6EXT9_9BILA